MKHFRLKGILGLLFLMIIMNACDHHSSLSGSKSVFFIAQPAEHYHAFNGHLNWYGRKRAGDLMRFLKDSSIQRIYTSPFSYSRETMDSLRVLQDIKTVEYPADSVGDKIFDLLEKNQDFGRRVLMIVSADKINDVAEKLGASSTNTLDGENKFNVIYRLENNKGKVNLHTLTYGGTPRPVSDSALKE
ncbi:MAG TPA: hypothetical protein VK084_03290 [Chitinophagaceae bacterium]|nr:hypothetical protein [Chitinophagaceae bacterium]